MREAPEGSVTLRVSAYSSAYLPLPGDFFPVLRCANTSALACPPALRKRARRRAK
jgi:hypothetical protein